MPLEQAQESARLATLAMYASLRNHLGDLDRVEAWLMINRHINAEPGHLHTTLVMNPCSDLILAAFGPDVGAHTRAAIGAMTVHLNLPVVIPAELSVRPSQRDWDAPNVSAELLEQTRRDQRRTARTAVFPCHARRSVGHKVVSASESSLDGQEAGLCGSSGEMHVTPGSVGAMIG